MSQTIGYPSEYTKLNEYIIDANGIQTTFLLKNNYVTPKYLGGGAQGRVIGARDKMNNKKVAIKQVRYSTESEFIDIQEEISILQSINQKNNISLIDTYQSTNCTNTEGEMYLVMESTDGDLSCIRNKLDHKKLSFLLFQLITGVNYLHSEGIVHRDLKPENVGVSRDGSLKILDFGLSRRMDWSSSFEPSRVGTRHYKAPELLLGSPFNQSADMWAVGCIAAELVLKDTLFAGMNETHQLETICQTLGQPYYQILQDIDFLQKTELNMYNLEIEEINSDINMPDHLFIHNTSIDLECSNQFRDLLNKLLEFDPSKRILAEEALHHPYFNKFTFLS